METQNVTHTTVLMPSVCLMAHGMEFAVHTSVCMNRSNSLAEGEKAFGLGLLPSTFTSSFKMVSVSWMFPYYISNI